jgi:hypothetical protein
VRCVSLSVKTTALLPFAVAAAAAIAACSSSPASTAGAPAATAAAATATTAATRAAAKAADGNITIAPADGMPPGPMKITPLSCGKLTAAQRSEYGTTAAAAFVYRFSNGSNTLVAAPKLSVNFTSGGAVVGSNVTAAITPVSPGQSGTGEVDALGDSGQGLKFSGCQVMSYALVTSSGVDPSSFAG